MPDRTERQILDHAEAIITDAEMACAYAAARQDPQTDATIAAVLAAPDDAWDAHPQQLTELFLALPRLVRRQLTAALSPTAVHALTRQLTTRR